MGLATQMLAWDEGFCALLAERGFRVVRFDNRDIGRSTKIDSAGVPSRLDMLTGRRATAPYLLRDMADDTIGLMDHLGIDSAHVVGASMGGMIVQTMAIDHPERVRSMVSIMSTTGNRWSGQPSLQGLSASCSATRRGRASQVIARAVKTFKVIGSPGLPLRRRARARDGRPLLRPRPHRRRRAAPAARDHRLRRPHPGPATASRSRPPSSTATATRSSDPPAAGPPRRRSPAPA